MNTTNQDAKALPATDTVGDDVPKPRPGPEIAVSYGIKDVTRGYLLEDQPAYTDDFILLYQGGNDLRTYTEILRDEQVKACLEQRISAVVSSPWTVEPGGDRAIDKLAAEFLHGQLEKIGINKFTKQMLLAVFYGFMACEVMYEPGKKYLEWKDMKVRNPRRFLFLADGSLRLRTMQSMSKGEPADAPYFWAYSHGAEFDDQPYGKGLAHWCYWLVKLKRNAIKYWMIFAEKFGAPTAIGTFPAAGATDADRANLLAAVGAVSTDAGITVPDSMKVELLQATRSGSGDYKALETYFDEGIAKAIIGQSLTTQQGSSRAQGQVHFAVRQDIVEDDANGFCDQFNSGPVAWLIGVNFPTAALPRLARVVEEPTDLNLLSERDQRLTSVGYRPTIEQVQATYGEGYEKIPPGEMQRGVQPVQQSDAQNLPGVPVSSGKGAS